MTLECRKCGRVIEPNEPMIAVVVDQPAQWGAPERIAERLAYARGRWHYRCAPTPVRRFASPVMPPRTNDAKLALAGLLAASIMAAIFASPASDVETIHELVHQVDLVADF